MKTSDGSFHQCFIAQAVVDADHQIVVATDVTDRANDVADLIPMTEQTIANAGRAPGEMLADAGYCSEDNLTKAGQVTATTGAEFYLHRVLYRDAK